MLLELMWRPAPPSRHNSESEQSIGHGKYPAWGLIEHDPVNPVLNEAALINALPSLQTQPVFKRSKRAFNAQPTFKNNH